MGGHLRFSSNNSLRIVALLGFCAGAIGSPKWLYAESKSTTGFVGAAYAGSQDASWILTEVKGKVNRALSIHLDLSPYPPPAGAFYTALVDVLESPDGVKPDIVPGVPEISVKCSKPGIYRLRIRANLIEKSSCALADARILKEQEIRLIITP